MNLKDKGQSNVALSPQKRLVGMSLCSGAGGLELGVSLALRNYRTVCWVERDAHAASTLVARMEDKALDEAPVWSDLATFDGKLWCGKVDIITAGYPCQPFSFAGKRTGEKDPRHLWPHVRRILGETAAPLLFAENVPGHATLGFEDVWNDLQAMGYQVEAGLFSAAEVGASHIRNRLFMLAYANSFAIGTLAANLFGKRPSDFQKKQVSARAAHNGQGLDNSVATGADKTPCLFAPPPHSAAASYDGSAAQHDLLPAVAGLADGLAHRVERYRLTGNGVVPLAAAYALSTLVLDAVKR